MELLCILCGRKLGPRGSFLFPPALCSVHTRKSLKLPETFSEEEAYQEGMSRVMQLTWEEQEQEGGVAHNHLDALKTELARVLPAWEHNGYTAWIIYAQGVIAAANAYLRAFDFEEKKGKDQDGG